MLKCKMKVKIYILIFLLILSSVNATKLQYNYLICGKSMYPLMNKDVDCAYYKVETVDKNNIKIGDVICFNYYKPDYVYSHYQYVCHQIINYDNNAFCTYGINNNGIYDRCMDWKYAALKVII